MTYFDYKVITAPRRLKRVRGVHDAGELFAHTLTEAINEQARDGWEYVRAESLTVETPKAWFRRATEEDQSVLVFRRARETLGPRIAAVAAPDPAHAVTPSQPHPAPSEPEPAEPNIFSDRRGQATRREPTRREPTLGPASQVVPTPLRPAPRIGPAERS